MCASLNVDNYFNANNPNINLGLKAYIKLRELTPYSMFCILGVILWFMSYAIFVSFKDIAICYLRRNDKFGRGYLYKFVEYKPYIKNLLMISGILVIFWSAVLLLLKEWRLYLSFSGFLISCIVYCLYWGKYYLIDKNDFDHFDEVKWLYQYLKTVIRPKKDDIDKIKQE